MTRYGLFIVAIALAHIAVVAPAKADTGKDMMVSSAYGGGGGGSYGGSSSSYSAPAAAPAAPAPSYGGGGSSYSGGGSSYSAPTKPASIPAPPCPKNYIFSCQPALSPVACSAPSSGGYGSAAAYSQYVPAYALPPYGFGY